MPKIIVRNPTDLEIERAAEIAWKAFSGSQIEHWQRLFKTVVEMFGAIKTIYDECALEYKPWRSYIPGI